jgi:hypothetical protein
MEEYATGLDLTKEDMIFFSGVNPVEIPLTTDEYIDPSDARNPIASPLLSTSFEGLPKTGTLVHF